jgi:predicted Rossmann fold flavoprotein
LIKKTYAHTGPLLITHWGLSGPAIIVLSAHAARTLFEQNYLATLHINFIPQHSFEAATQALNTHRSNCLQKKIHVTNPFDLPSSFWERFVTLNLRGNDILYQDLSKGMIHTLIQTLRNTKFQIKGKGKFKEEFVTSGGVRLKEVNFKTMESRMCPNLYFAGEVLNIDGVTGGFNFQSAWTTGWIASQYM